MEDSRQEGLVGAAQMLGEMLVKHTRDSVCENHGAFSESGYQFSSKRINWTGCPECSRLKAEAREAEAELKRRIEEQQRLERLLDRSGIPHRFRDRGFDNYTASTDRQRTALTVARDYAENFDDNYRDGFGLIFSGKAGTGKSHLAIAIAQAVMPKYTALYINAMDVIRMVRDTWRRDSERSESEVLDQLGKIGLLIIDEVGVQVGTENEQMLMFEVINRRYRDMKPVILLTNLNSKGFSEYLTERSFDRLRENSKWVTFDWESYRGKRAA